ncbi:hypothetical protein C4565_10975 [Candidatus Parcubacteria bacterium]|jgi:hypothetical protein|nr:MAG: hypothetical protein C4565_10975 [Candidatus Parcubacteria bacterium]
MIPYISIFVVFLGIAVSIFIVIQNIKLKRSLIGSFFKKSYNRATFGSIFLLLSFLTELLETLGILGSIAYPIHHIFLVISSVAFFSVAIIFPKETESILSQNKEEKGL